MYDAFGKAYFVLLDKGPREPELMLVDSRQLVTSGKVLYERVLFFLFDTSCVIQSLDAIACDGQCADYRGPQNATSMCYTRAAEFTSPPL